MFTATERSHLVTGYWAIGTKYVSAALFTSTSIGPRRSRTSATAASQLLPQLFKCLAEVGAEIRETTLSQSSLESLFIKLTGKELRE